MAIEATPEGGLPSAPVGSEAVTETVKLVEVVCDGSALTVLVGGVVSISQEVDCEPGPRRRRVQDVGGVDGQGVGALGGR